MKIKRIEASYLTGIPIPPPPFLNEPITSSTIIAEVETDTGIIGYGATGGPAPRSISLPWSIVDFINLQMEPFLKDDDPLLTERIWQKMFGKYNRRALTGVWSAAMAAVDIALWDIKGKALGQAVWRLLGGAKNPVPCYTTFGRAEYDRERLVEAAKFWVARGSDKLKMVVGVAADGEDPDEDAARVRLVREAIGPKIQLMMDANCMMPFPAALRLCKLCEQYDITWFEEPVVQNDAKLMANLRRQTTIPIAGGQYEGHRFRHRELLLEEAVDIVMPNVVNVGGYTEAVKVAALAQTFSKPIANGGAWGFHNMHLQAGMANGWRVEFHFLSWEMCKAVYKSTPEPNKGWLTVPDTPGLGLDPKPGIIKEYRTKPA